MASYAYLGAIGSNTRRVADVSVVIEGNSAVSIPQPDPTPAQRQILDFMTDENAWFYGSIALGFVASLGSVTLLFPLAASAAGAVTLTAALGAVGAYTRSVSLETERKKNEIDKYTSETIRDKVLRPVLKKLKQRLKEDDLLKYAAGSILAEHYTKNIEQVTTRMNVMTKEFEISIIPKTESFVNVLPVRSQDRSLYQIDNKYLSINFDNGYQLMSRLNQIMPAITSQGKYTLRGKFLGSTEEMRTVIHTSLMIQPGSITSSAYNADGVTIEFTAIPPTISMESLLPSPDMKTPGAMSYQERIFEADLFLNGQIGITESPLMTSIQKIVTAEDTIIGNFLGPVPSAYAMLDALKPAVETAKEAYQEAKSVAAYSALGIITVLILLIALSKSRRK